MKGFSIQSEFPELVKHAKRLVKCAICFFAKQSMIFCIEHKDDKWHFTDKKNTEANDIVIK